VITIYVCVFEFEREPPVSTIRNSHALHQLGNRCITLQSKDPVYENGNYRLNFNGRVSVPSVKNFQIVSAERIDDVLCQFGKVCMCYTNRSRRTMLTL
jgi:hypothetical protein